jgi:hypothetical protein
MARLLSQVNREIEVGNDINLNLLLTLETSFRSRMTRLTTTSSKRLLLLLSHMLRMCLADDYLVGSQLSPGTPSNLPRDKMVSNQLSLYSSSLAFQAQHASS